MAAAANDLAGICSDLSVAHSAAAQATVALTPAAADEVSVGIAHLFSEHAHGFQALAGKASAFHGQFVENLKASAASYVSADGPIYSLTGREVAAPRSALYGLEPVRRFIDFWSNPPPLPDLVGGLGAGLLVGGLFFGGIAVVILLFLVELPIMAIRAVQAALGLPLPPWPIP
jgi:hypothetical protein